MRVAPYGGLAAPLPPQGAPQTPQAPPTGAGSPYSPSHPTLTSASPGSTSPGERRKPPGTWAARVGRAQEDSGEEDNNERRDGNTDYNSNNIMNVEPSSLVKMNDSFIPSDQENAGSQESVNNKDTLVRENETIITPSTKASNNTNPHKDLYITLNNHDIYNIHSGRLVQYSGSESDSEEERDRESILEYPNQAPSPSASPSPSPHQRRRNQQGEHVLANFVSRTLLALLGEALRREDS